MRPDTSIYIIGTQCTGKTTLVNALFNAFHSQRNDIVIHRIPEVARTVLRETGITRDDITNDPWKALELQKLILRAQYEAESKQSGNLVLSDPSGIDALVYAARYGPPGSRETLENTREWQYLRSRMMQSLVIFCSPHWEWLVDDGTRLMPNNWEDWQETHMIYYRALIENGLYYVVLPDSDVLRTRRPGWLPYAVLDP